MAIFSEDESQDSSFPTQALPEWQKPEEEKPLTGQEVATLETRSAEQNNWLGSLIHNGLGDWSKDDPMYNPVTKLKDTDYINYPEFFINTDNDQELEAAKHQVDELKQYQELSSRAPSLSFWSSMAWGMIDPTLAIPGVGAVKLAKAGKIVKVGQTAGITGLATAGAIGAGELVKQAGQPQLTAEESEINIAAAGIVGAAFGGLAGHFAPNPSFADDTIRATTKAQTDSMGAVKQVLDISDSKIEPDYVAASQNISKDDYTPISTYLDNENSMEGHVSPFTKNDFKANGNNQIHSVAQDKVEFEARQKQFNEEEEMLAELTKTPEGELGDLETSAQGIGAEHVTYDVRVKGLHPYVLKSIAIPHVINPSIEGLADASGVVRDFTSRIGYMHMALEKEGVQVTAPYSLESAMQADQLKGLDFNKYMDGTYLRYLQIDPEGKLATAKGILKGRSSGVIKSKEFDEMTMDAMNANDHHVIPEVQERAQYTRKLVNDQFEEMKRVGVLEKDTQPFPSWFKVVYDMPTIINDRIGFEKALTNRLLNKVKVLVKYENAKGELKEATAVMNIKNKNINWMPKEGEKLKEIVEQGGARLSPDEAREMASEMTDNILQMGDKNLALGDIDRLSFTRGSDSGKPRTIVTDEEDYLALKPWMVKNFRQLTHQYLASTSRAINYKKLLNSMGVDKLQDVRVRIKEEGKAKIYRIQNAATYKGKPLTDADRNKMIAKVNKQIIKSEALFNDLASISLGQFKKRTNADSFFRTLNQYNIARLYGGILISSLGDPMSMLIKNSLPNAIWNGWLSELRQIISGTKSLKTQDYRNAMTAIQNEMDDLSKAIMNPDQTPYSVGKVERTAQIMGNSSMKVSGMTTWNNFWQRASHNLAESNILKYTNNPTVKGEAYLKEIGISPSMGKRIKKMQEKYGHDIKGTHISNSHMWSDREAADLFNNAIRVEVHKSPLMTEMLDIPRFFQKSEMRKSMVLGKGFSFGALTKLTLSAASRHDAFALQGVIALTLAGMVVKILQDKIKGRETPDMSLREWILTGVNLGGVGGIITDPLFQAYQAAKSIDKYGEKAWVTEPMDYIMGPNASIINPAYRAIMLKAQGKETNKLTEYQLKSLIPYSKLWYLPNSGKK